MKDCNSSVSSQADETDELQSFSADGRGFFNGDAWATTGPGVCGGCWRTRRAAVPEVAGVKRDRIMVFKPAPTGAMRSACSALTSPAVAGMKKRKNLRRMRVSQINQGLTERPS